VIAPFEGGHQLAHIALDDLGQAIDGRRLHLDAFGPEARSSAQRQQADHQAAVTPH
jgi:hypothetical protein